MKLSDLTPGIAIAIGPGSECDSLVHQIAIGSGKRLSFIGTSNGPWSPSTVDGDALDIASKLDFRPLATDAMGICRELLLNNLKQRGVIP